MKPRNHGGAPGFQKVGSLLPQILPTQIHSDTTTAQSGTLPRTSSSTGQTVQDETRPCETGQNAGKVGVARTDDAPDHLASPDEIPKILRRIKSGLKDSLVQRIASNEGLNFPSNSEPYSVEREPFYPPRLHPETANQVQAVLDQLAPYLAPAERHQILARSVALLTHYYTPVVEERLLEAVAEDWFDDLCEFPMWVIQEACTYWRRTEPRKRPSPGDIRARCFSTIREWQMLAKKLRITLDRFEKEQD